jgi:HSP20 family protein
MKTMTLYRPNAIQHALSDFDRYFDYFAGDSFLAPATKIFNRAPAVDIRETEKAYMVEMDLPGYDEKDIEIHVDGSILSIASKQETASPADSASPKETAFHTESVPFVGPREEKDKDKEAASGSWLIRERRVSAFSRSFKLPENANPEDVNAEFKNGVLRLEIQKRAEAQKRTIEIKVR